MMNEYRGFCQFWRVACCLCDDEVRKNYYQHYKSDDIESSVFRLCKKPVEEGLYYIHEQQTAKSEADRSTEGDARLKVVLVPCVGLPRP